MGKNAFVTISVRPEDEIDAVSHLCERGFKPTKIDGRDGGLVALLLSPEPDQMVALSKAIPDELIRKAALHVADEDENTLN